MKTTFSEEYKRVVTSLISARKERGIRQVDIAAKLRKPQSFVAKYENRERLLDMVEFTAVCRAIGISPALILYRSNLLTPEDFDFLF